ncbi:hypothetical protein PSTG_01234 [Puccinia striiformis f. sp. tritici PST-78]|uniref:Uncharacterized protein n=1 Tax=Puccinia striiformis f. sp. tritici PST-78 TaxID=1165861 RepID=A0A0L0W300_9BASI|nr:hypothetical protein PSTG_01234 [Puccinia striiformis f. sp. tritici PST-78]
MCLYCLLPKSKINNINELWPKRTLENHREWVQKACEATSVEEKGNILKEHGVHYSVVLEIPYWNILEYHMVDAMHNILLGPCKWHCQRFWHVTDKVNEINIDSVSKAKLYRSDAKTQEAEKEAEKAQAEAEKKEAKAERAKANVALANTQPPPVKTKPSPDNTEPPSVGGKKHQPATKRATATGKRPKNPRARLPQPPAPEELETYFLEMLFGTSTDPSDTKFIPPAGTHEWGGECVPPSDGKVIFDGPVLSHIN